MTREVSYSSRWAVQNCLVLIGAAQFTLLGLSYFVGSALGAAHPYVGYAVGSLIAGTTVGLVRGTQTKELLAGSMMFMATYIALFIALFIVFPHPLYSWHPTLVTETALTAAAIGAIAAACSLVGAFLGRRVHRDEGTRAHWLLLSGFSMMGIAFFLQHATASALGDRLEITRVTGTMFLAAGVFCGALTTQSFAKSFILWSRRHPPTWVTSWCCGVRSGSRLSDA